MDNYHIDCILMIYNCSLMIEINID